MDRLKVSTKEENSANCIISHSWELLKQSRLKIGCQGWIAWVRVSEILIVSFPPFIEDFVSYSWKIVAYQKHPLFSCLESFHVLRTELELELEEVQIRSRAISNTSLLSMRGIYVSSPIS